MVELTPNITAELNENGDRIGIEILNASSYIRNAVMETSRQKCSGLQRQGQLEAGLTILYPNRFLVRRAHHERKFNEDFIERTEDFVCRVLRP
jgi:hypothetical protein